MEQEKLLESLSNAVISGDAEQVEQIQRDLDNLKIQAVGDRAAHLRQSIEYADKRLIEIKEEISVLEAERGVRMKKLGVAEQAYLDAKQAVQKCDVVLFGLDGESTTLHENKYDAKIALEELSSSIKRKYTGEK